MKSKIGPQIFMTNIFLITFRVLLDPHINLIRKFFVAGHLQAGNVLVQFKNTQGINHAGMRT